MSVLVFEPLETIYEINEDVPSIETPGDEDARTSDTEVASSTPTEIATDENSGPLVSKRRRSFHKRVGRFLHKHLLCCVRPNAVGVL